MELMIHNQPEYISQSVPPSLQSDIADTSTLTVRASCRPLDSIASRGSWECEALCRININKYSITWMGFLLPYYEVYTSCCYTVTSQWPYMHNAYLGDKDNPFKWDCLLTAVDVCHASIYVFVSTPSAKTCKNLRNYQRLLQLWVICIWTAATYDFACYRRWCIPLFIV